MYNENKIHSDYPKPAQSLNNSWENNAYLSTPSPVLLRNRFLVVGLLFIEFFN